MRKMFSETFHSFFKKRQFFIGRRFMHPIHHRSVFFLQSLSRGNIRQNHQFFNDFMTGQPFSLFDRRYFFVFVKTDNQLRNIQFQHASPSSLLIQKRVNRQKRRHLIFQPFNRRLFIKTFLHLTISQPPLRTNQSSEKTITFLISFSVQNDFANQNRPILFRQ